MTHKLFCEGPLLDAVQRGNIFPDCKTFVDLHLKDHPDVVQEAFQKLTSEGEVTIDNLRAFLSRWFSGPGGELEDWVPTDWTDSPQLLTRIKNDFVRTFVKQLNGLWKILGKKVCSEMADHPERYTLLPVPNPFIVPGDRFRELYYWDSYWIVGGLLACGMNDTVKGMIGNLLHMVKTYGMVPNGGRAYFLNRSQPPLLVPMVDLYLRQTGDIAFVRHNIDTLATEMAFWGKRMCEIRVGGKGVHLARYWVEATGPRPEGYRADVELAANMSEKDSMSLFSEIQSACESGWDFSSRWFRDMSNLSSINTRNVFPVDLNSFLCLNFKIMAKFYSQLGDQDKRQEYNTKAQQLQKDIHSSMWDAEEGCWFDLHVPSESDHLAQPRKAFYISNLTPLFADCCSVDLTNEKNVMKILHYIQHNDITNYCGGPPTSLTSSGEQWDYPNVWPPLVHVLVDGLSRIPHIKAKKLAEGIAQAWIQANAHAFYQTGHMFEKYNCERPGRAGSGGEYNVQLGFGWTNGVCLMLIDKYADSIGYDVTLTSTNSN